MSENKQWNSCTIYTLQHSYRSVCNNRCSNSQLADGQYISGRHTLMTEAQDKATFEYFGKQGVFAWDRTCVEGNR